MKTSTTILTALALLVGTLACREPMPCDDCDDNADAAEEPDDNDQLPDLPCGGADLMTDNDNCGTCGHRCPVRYEGTQWEAGACNGGECGPYWITCLSEFGGADCNEICDLGTGQTCVANGCSGLTALVFHVGFDSCDIPDNLHETMAGPCDEPIPWETGPMLSYSTQARCCCK